MVRRRLSGPGATLGLALTLLASFACGEEREMAERVEMPDTMPVMEALEDDEVRDAMLDTMPGGEMARGDSAVEMELLKKKLQDRRDPEGGAEPR